MRTATLVFVVGLGGALLAGCTSEGTEPAPTTTLTAATSTTAATTPAQTTAPATPTSTSESEPQLVVDELDDFAPRSVVYTNLEFEVTGARSSNQDLRSFAEGGEPVVDPEATFAYLDMTVTNLATRTQIALDETELFLDVGGDRIAAATEMSFLSDFVGINRPNSATESFLAFPVAPDTDLAEATLVIGASPDRPAQLPLTGEVPDDGYPVTMELSGSAEGIGATNAGTLVYTLLDVAITLDRPHEESTSPTGERADEDELFLVVHLDIEKTEGRGSEAIGNDLRLLVDDRPLEPWDVAIDPTGSTPAPTVAPGASSDAWVAFLVPADAAELVLQVGDFEESPGLLPVDITPLP